jgi:PAS domain S-box-containing protein
MQTGKFKGELNFVRKDGSILQSEISSVIYLDKEGNQKIGTFIRDITERKKAEESLRKEKDKAQKYLDIAGVIFVVLNTDHTISLVNKKSLEILGYKEEEIIGKNWFELFIPEKDKNQVKRAFEKILAGEIELVEYYENPILTKDGKERIIEWHNTVIKDENGIITTILSSGMDITERKKAEELLHQTKEQLRLLMENSEDFIAMQDREGRYLYYNAPLKYGISSDEVIGKTPFDIHDPSSAEEIMESLRRVVNEGDTLKFESDQIWMGESLWFNHHIYPIKDSSGKVISVGTIARDITTQKILELELKKHKDQLEELVKERTLELMLSNKKLEDEIIEGKKTAETLLQSKIILDSIADGVFTVDTNSIIKSFNKAAEIITGFNTEDALGIYYTEIFKIDVSRLNLRKKYIDEGDILDQLIHIHNKSGTRIPVSLSTSKLTDNNGNITGLAYTFRDLSKIENLRKAIEKSYTFQDIVSKNTEMQKIFDILPDVATADSTVLIEGQTGTGKDLLAIAIHNISKRKNKIFEIINCGTFPPQLMESELFGYVKGAFTDAKSDKKGKVAVANGGTLFFDEIGDLPFNLQVKLLRLLESHEYEPVGSTKPLKADIRVIAATNKNLQELVRNGKFRDDLYFRLNIVRFYLPPLSQRKEDIPYLIEHFITKYNGLKGKNIHNVSTDVMQILLNHSFPGNIRELENIIEYAFITCKGNIIEVGHLPNEIKNISQDIPFDEEEKEKIIFALEKFNGNKSKACKELNISYATLFRKLKKYNIQK